MVQLAHRRLAPLDRVDGYDLAAALFFATLLVLLIATFRDYAISNDEGVQQRYGELIIAYYASGLANKALFHFKDLYLYGGLFDVAAVGLEQLLPLDLYAARHLLSALTGVGGIAAAWATARALGGPRAGLLAGSALALCGIWYGAMFNHTKDIPFAAAMMGAIYSLVLLGRELPRPRWRLVLLFGVLFGCALGIRVFGLFLIFYAVLIVAAWAPIGANRKWREVFAFATRSALSLAPAFAIAYAIMIAAWPWAGLAPLNPLRAMRAFGAFHYHVETVLAGHVYQMADVPRSYVPIYVAIKLTLPLLTGACLALILTVSPPRGGLATGQAWASPAWRKETGFIACAAFLPLICNVVAHGPAFSGMRHFLFIAPPIAALAGLGFDAALSRLEARSRLGRLAAAAALALVLLAFGFDASRLYQLHPDEYLFFNPLVGGLQGASRRYDTDYWVNIMPEAVADLEHYLDRTDHASAAPIKRRYLVVVCGERLSFEKEADKRLQWTSDWDRADFFIAPTNMNCDRVLDGRVIATVERLGVPIGFVKDRRAMIHPNVARTDGLSRSRSSTVHTQVQMPD